MTKEVCKEVDEEVCKAVVKPVCKHVTEDECKEEIVKKWENQCNTIQKEQVIT